MPASPGQPFVNTTPAAPPRVQPAKEPDTKAGTTAASPPSDVGRPKPAAGSGLGLYTETPPPETSADVIRDAPHGDNEQGEPWQEEETVVSQGPPKDEFGDVPVDDPDLNVHVEFDQQASDEPFNDPPPVKRVQVSNQLDILAELEGLRAGSLSEATPGESPSPPADLDIDSLISGAVSNSKEIRRNIQQQLNSDVFDRMRGLEVAIRIHDGGGETIHTLEPVSLSVDDAGELAKLSLRFVIDLDNLQ